jgi:squalene-hopene/tetraprenyl-beta-curcumene cyclase
MAGMSDPMAFRLERGLKAATSLLLSELSGEGGWVGRLSGSALSTATAVTALAAVDARAHKARIDAGLSWLAANQNPDGGWGDTIRSRSNLSTTALVWAAFGLADGEGRHRECVKSAESYLIRAAGSLEGLPGAIEACYGKDRTFSIPILMMLALCGRLGPEGWRRVRALPFELAALPRGLFGALRLPVVSYALPALIAIGQAIHRRSGRLNPLRDLTMGRTLRVLEEIQPVNGGFLEATPLTSFVTMSLAAAGRGDHVVARKGVGFLVTSARADGSWPIDTNLSTWVTTLAVKALRHQPGVLASGRCGALREWLLRQQFLVKHPYTGADPGGWSWTPLPGAVPDADDTAGALLALWELRGKDDAAGVDARARCDGAAVAGVRWLLDVQNRDGGIPTFCRGWGTLPFDRSTPELTAHALRAWRAWKGVVALPRVRVAMDRALGFLADSQRSDGAWVPLWFGNENAPRDENPVYGTSMVLQALENGGRELAMVSRARQFLLGCQNADGGWGGDGGVGSTIEETALAVEALAAGGDAVGRNAARRGVEWLLGAMEAGGLDQPSPIGLYFASLWYFERLYPVIFSVSALGVWARNGD